MTSCVSFTANRYPHITLRDVLAAWSFRCPSDSTRERRSRSEILSDCTRDVWALTLPHLTIGAKEAAWVRSMRTKIGGKPS